MLQKYSGWRVLRVFFDDPSPETLGLSLREISRRSGLAHTSVKKHLQTLEEEGLVKTRQEKRGSRTYPVYRSNRNSEKFKHFKTVDMVFRIGGSGILDVIEGETTPDCIVLFGSAARGEDVRSSDIDLYVQSEEKELDLSEYESFLERSVQLHFQPDFNSYPPELRNNIVNGITLRGFLKAYKGVEDGEDS